MPASCPNCKRSVRPTAYYATFEGYAHYEYDTDVLTGVAPWPIRYWPA